MADPWQALLVPSFPQTHSPDPTPLAHEPCMPPGWHLPGMVGQRIRIHLRALGSISLVNRMLEGSSVLVLAGCAQDGRGRRKREPVPRRLCPSCVTRSGGHAGGRHWLIQSRAGELGTPHLRACTLSCCPMGALGQPEESGHGEERRGRPGPGGAGGEL